MSSYNVITRETKVGIPLEKEPLEKEEEQWSSSSDDEDNGVLISPKQDSQTSPIPSINKDTHEGNCLPTSKEYYGFELNEPSAEDKKIYNRLVDFISVYHKQ